MSINLVVPTVKPVRLEIQYHKTLDGKYDVSSLGPGAAHIIYPTMSFDSVEEGIKYICEFFDCIPV